MYVSNITLGGIRSTAVAGHLHKHRHTHTHTHTCTRYKSNLQAIIRNFIKLEPPNECFAENFPLFAEQLFLDNNFGRLVLSLRKTTVYWAQA